MTDWNAAFASWGANIALAAGGLIALGQARQQVKDLEKRVGEQGASIAGLESAVAKIGDVDHAVDLLRQNQEGAHAMLLQQLKSGQELSGERFEGLRGEVRAFMQGSASRENNPRTSRAKSSA